MNTDGTVSVISTDTITQDVGTAAVFESAYAFDMDSVYDISNDKTIIFYQDNDNNGYLTAVVVTHASDGGLTYTTPVVAHSVQAYYVAASYDVAQAGKTVVYWRDQADPYPGKALVATLSGTSLSFGSAVTFNSTQTNYMVSSYDTNAEKHVVIYTDIQGSGRVSARVGTVSGTSISFGTEAVVRNHNNTFASIVYDSNAQKHVCIWRDGGDSRGNSGYANVGTISGTDISFGSDVQFEAGAVSNGDRSLDIQFDSTNNKVIIFYYDAGNSNYGTAVVGTVSGTSISFGTPVVFEASNSPDYIRASFDTNVSKFLVAYRHASDGSKGKFRIATISGTSVSFTDATTFNNGGQTQPYSVVFDPDIKRHIIPYHDTSNSNYGTAISVRVAGETASNLTASTSESFIGFAEDTVATGQPVTINTKGAIVDNIPAQLAAGSAGTPVVPDEEGAFISATFDSNSNRVVVAYQDGDNSNYGTAVVGTVTASDNSISHGTPVVFNSANTYYTESTFDSNSNKVVITYRNIGDSNRGTAIVGTVDPSDNSISFGTAVVYEAGETSNSSSAFDSSNNKVVIAYEDEDDSQKGKAIVGTVSGTAISFGTAAVFNNANTGFTSTAFDTTNNKVVIAFADKGNSNRGTAIVGTVSGTDISFGSEVIFNSGTSAEIHHSISFNPVAGKMLIAYVDTDDSEKGKAIVGTVSGTSISFGTASVYNTRPEQSETVYDSQKDLIVIVYGDNNNSRRGTAIGATISGTSVSFSDELAFHSSSGNKNGVRVTYDSNANKAVAAYTDLGNSNVLTTTVFATAGNGPITPAQTYFVQTDGTLSQTADSPSVTAGTAVAGSTLIVKG